MLSDRKFETKRIIATGYEIRERGNRYDAIPFRGDSRGPTCCYLKTLSLKNMCADVLYAFFKRH